MNFDGYESALLGGFSGRPMLSVQSAAHRYESGGLYRTIVDKPADTAVARGVAIVGDEGRAIEDELDRLKALPALSDALRWARLTGGGAIVLIADDGRLLRDELNVQGLRWIEQLRVFDLSALSVATRYMDPAKASFGTPQTYRVRAAQMEGYAADFIVHESRLIGVGGDPLPPSARAIPWAGKNAVDRPYQAVARYGEALRLALSILNRKQQAVYGMQGLAELVKAGMEAVAQKRIELVDAVRGVRNTVAVDIADEYTIQDSNLSGIKDIINETQIAVSAESNIPAALLFGRAPSGLNATGEADFEGFYDTVEGLQRTRLTPALERLVSLILIQSKFEGQIPESWAVTWPPIASPTAKEEAEIRKTNAEARLTEAKALETVVSIGAVSEEGARAHLVRERQYGLGAEVSDDRAGAIDYSEQA